MIARVSTLWDIARRSQPAMIARFDALRPWMRRQEQAQAVAQAYRNMDSVNFSRDIVEPAAGRMVALPMDDVHWSDWGRPQRIAQTLAKIGKTQSFPTEIVEESSRHEDRIFASAA